MCGRGLWVRRLSVVGQGDGHTVLTVRMRQAVRSAVVLGRGGHSLLGFVAGENLLRSVSCKNVSTE